MSWKKREWLLFFGVFLIHGAFYHGGSWNQNARYDSIRAFVEPGHPETFSFKIDRFIVPVANTGDWASFGGHYFSNKAPGSSILGIPLYFALFYGEHALGLDPGRLWSLNNYLLNLWISVFWTALSCVYLLRVMGSVKPQISSNQALGLVLIYSFGTLIFPFDTQLWGHLTVAAFLILGLYQLTRKDQPKDLFYSGVWIGLAALTEYSASLSLVLTFGYLVYRRTSLTGLVSFCVGAFPGVAALLIYDKIYFGGFFSPAPAHCRPGAWEGLTWPVPKVIFYYLTVSLERGFFVYCPVLFFSLAPLFGVITFSKSKLMNLCRVTVISYLVLISAHTGWHGGLTAGPRYLISSLPFWVLLLPALSELKSHAMRALYAALVTLSIANMVVITATTPMVSEYVVNPLYGQLYSQFISGKERFGKFVGFLNWN